MHRYLVNVVSVPNCLKVITHTLLFACMFVFFIIFLCSKKLFSAVHNFVHLNLAVALFVGYLTFAVGVELAKDNKVKSGLHPMPSFLVTLLTSAVWGFCHSIASA